MPDDRLSASLVLAYAEAMYEFRRSGRWVSCDSDHLPLEASSGAGVLAVLSACDPASRPLDARANRRRHQALCAALRAAGIAHRPARGRAADGSWVEASVLLQAPIAAIDRLARRFGQNAAWLPGPPPTLRLYAEALPGLPGVMAKVRLEWVGCGPPAAPDPA